MSIKPIDLQTLFTHLQDVGKQQAHVKESIAANQAIQAQELTDKTKQEDNKVNDPQEIEDGPGKVKEDQGNPRGKAKQQKEKEGEKGSEEENDSSELFDDPDLGKHIDITG